MRRALLILLLLCFVTSVWLMSQASLECEQRKDNVLKWCGEPSHWTMALLVLLLGFALAVFRCCCT